MKVKQMLLRESSTLVPEIDRRTDAEDLAITIRFKDNHFHHILPANESVTKQMVVACAEHIGALSAAQTLDDQHNKSKAVCQPEPLSEVVFKNRQAIGDILCMTAAVRDFKKTFPGTKVGVSTTAMHLWDHNPHIDHQFRDVLAIKEIGPGKGTNRSNSWNINLIDAFRMSIEEKTGLAVSKTDVRPDIWMTREEIKRPALIDGDYWTIITGGEPGWTAKQYHRWQEVANLLRSSGVRLVQLGVSSHPWVALDGAENWIGRTEDKDTGIRDLFNIFFHSQGSIGLVSMHMHLSAAFGNPCVVVAGAREPAWFTQYYGHQYIHTNGTTSCGLYSACWKCDVIKGCRSHAVAPVSQLDVKGTLLPVPTCVDIIEPEEILAAVMKYYKGGRLKIGTKVPNTFFSNVVEEPKTYSMPKPEATDEELVAASGMKWGGGCITGRDWAFIKQTLDENKVQNVLEFGAGLSTLLLRKHTTKVDTYETSPGWVAKISKLATPLGAGSIVQWDGANFPSFGGINYDLAFVDGPSGGGSREHSTKVASMLANIVIVHDAGREAERKWQKMNLEEEFELVSKGGHRCHLWKRKSLARKAQDLFDVQTAAEPNGKTVMMITTCRGYGGSERSTIEIMRLLQRRGYEVYLAPTGKIGGEYNFNLPKDVVVVPWEQVKGAAVDLAVLYASDTIWNFRQPQYTEVMDTIEASRKVMVLNYQLGGSGIIDWTRHFDLYMFLNSTKEQQFKALVPDSQTMVLPPPTNLDRFFSIQPNYSNNLRLIRHSSQGDAKHPDYTNQMISDILALDQKLELFFMPARSDCLDDPRVHKHARNQPSVPEFLSLGNCFFYHLPPGYEDQGPRTICEAMAAGLPVIADNRWGAKDRVTPETGWLVNNVDEIIDVVREIKNDLTVLATKGSAARERAKKEFVMERWVEAIVGTED